MKKQIVLLQVLFLLLLSPRAAYGYGNDYLENSDHYSAMITGEDKVHFKLPVYSRGTNDYYVSMNGQGESRVYYVLDGEWYTIFGYGSEHNLNGPSADDDVAYGRAWVKGYAGRGVLEITNCSDGQRKGVPSDNAEHSYNVTKKEESGNDGDYVTWLEVDWYIPESLDKKTFDIGTKVFISLRYTGNVNYEKNWTLATGLEGKSNVVEPQLFEPYIYAVNEQGFTGYGSAAIQYSVFYDPISYSTSLAPNEFTKTTERSGNIIVPTNDTVQKGVFAYFNIYRSKSPVQLSTQVTNKVDILPYHRLYDFSVTEEKDATGTFTGNNMLEWHVKNPNLIDLVSGDYFEVQRAFKEDFSDAKQLAVIPMIKHDTAHTYRYVDNSREMWTGNVNYLADTNAYYSVKEKDYRVYDEDDEPFASFHVELVNTEKKKPSLPVYYRVRRASSAVWGWVEDFSKKAAVDKHNYLAPLDSIQENYTLDPEYESNRKVHFNIHINNAEVPKMTFHKEGSHLNWELNRILTTRNASVTIRHEGTEAATMFKVVHPDGTVQFDFQPLPDGTITVPIGSTVYVKNTISYLQPKFQIFDNSTIHPIYSEVQLFPFGGPTSSSVHVDFEGPTLEDVVNRYKADIIDSLHQVLQATVPDFGNCMWDRTARLILQRTIQETGYVSETIIPQDSIIRLSDGSWLARFTDVANMACSHISYSVRIDQSGSDLCVFDSVQLQPVAIHGPSLYFDEAATITSFTASQGAAVGAQKRGVNLNWIPSSTAVDEYVLSRVAVNSDAAADTIYTGTDNSFFDESAIPNQHYEYIITALYNCNGKSSANSATAEGWRSPYGEISGTILMPDNSGLAGVNVDLENEEGTTVKSVITGADGSFLFDSLTYDIAGATQYVIIPTHTYAHFSYNNTSAQSAAVTLSADHAVSSGINFANTSTVRLTGRALYKLSTIPVSGAMFTLNGDTVLRNGAPLTTGTDGNFELTVCNSQPYVLRIFKPGHVFEGDGILHVEEGKDTFALTKPLDGVRFYDQTKVRLVGRVAGGIDQRDLPEAFGLGTNNLGDDLQLVLQLEGDNIAHFVHDPDDLSRDTMMQQVEHRVYQLGNEFEPYRVVGTTNTLLEKKRITIHPDPATGEFEVDLFPVKYKVVQASAQGYSTLFASGAGSETFNLTNAPLQPIDVVREGDSVHYNAVYDRIYRTPVQVHLKQLLYGLEQDGYGEPTMNAGSLNPTIKEKVNLYTKQEDGTIRYTMGYPVFYYNRRYQFEAQAYENYYYNNDPTQRLDRVPLRSGKVTVRNGMHNSTNHTTYELNQQGKNRNVWLTVDHIQTQTYGEDALATVSLALEQEGNTVETDAFRGYVAGDIVQGNELTATEADITLLDIIRDPGGNGSSAWVESGTTYSYSYNESYNWEAGLKLTPKWGLNVSNDVGIVTAPSGAGSYTGSTFNSSKQLSFTIPITHEWSWGYKYSYSFTTNEKISTSTKKNKTGIGSNADVFLGATISQLTGKAKSLTVIDDTLYQARRPAIEAGTMHVHASGIGADGKPYYLVTGEKVVMGSTVSNTFAYSQYYILETVIPQLALQRQNLLMTFPDSTAAQAQANATGEPVYWYIDSTAAAHLQDTVARSSYRMFLPEGSNAAYADKVAALNNIILKWMTIVIQNEREKIIARQSGQYVGTYSVSFGNTLSHTDSYSATANYNEMPQGGDLVMYEMQNAGAQVAEELANSLDDLAEFFGDNAETFGKSAAEALKGFFNDEAKTDQKSLTEIGTVTNTYQFKMNYSPVLDYEANDRMNTDKTIKKSCGFTLVPDDQGDITVSVYRAEMDSLWKSDSKDVRDNVGQGNNDDILFGSYVFFTEAGATYCVHEKEEKTKFYNKGTVINNGTMAIAVPEISIDRYEVSNVPANQRAVFHIELKNQGQVQYGFPATGTGFSLSLTGDSNPHGAKVYINGAPLVQGLSYFLTPGQVARQVMEVERGEVDDYENLTLYFSVGDCVKTYAFLNFSVHFQPESSPVEIASPRQNWVMNTLSQRDSAGYYIPIDITGFNIHHKNFDHIEFQYKLSKESDEMWVNQCSFYANDSLYDRATGNKAMIENGRIAPFRFYGERDPMEQEYDLRAVSFCRYGSGFVSKASPVISGVKDTRPPVLFGEPQPANAILGIGDDLKLRFSEPIAGNYLDEDNNFQLRGVTNETGITAGTSVHFDGTAESFAITKTTRSLRGKSFSVDMLVRPTNPNKEEYFFTYSSEDGVSFSFGKSDENRLFAEAGDVRVFSKPLESPMLAFTRVTLTYDKTTKLIRFFAGTSEVTDPSNTELIDVAVFDNAAPLLFGQGFDGDMLEARLWTKALSKDEIAATNGHYLTGYERELLAYYRMNEGKGEVMTDKANGATLYLYNAAWKLQKGISLALDNQAVELAGDVLGRTQSYDETLMFWFKTASPNATLFRAGWVKNDSLTTGTLLAIEDGTLVLHNGSQSYIVSSPIVQNEWHHFVLAVSRTYNTVAVYLDGELTNSLSASRFGAVNGAMYLGGDGFKGNFDELAVFEQMLPATLIREYYSATPVGDEMGLMGYLPFQEQRVNSSGVMELVYSPNDQRVFRDPNGNEVEKVVPLVITKADNLADKANYAPVRTNSMLSKLNFGWTFKQEELLLNIKMQDNEINKQMVYITVRDVEDLHGNPMPSPVTWAAFVDRNPLHWENNKMNDFRFYDTYAESYYCYYTVITNATGRRHQYTIESLPDWLSVEIPSGSIQPMESKEIRLCPDINLPAGVYTDIVYLTDENGLSDPLYVEFTLKAECPYSQPEDSKFSMNMSICGQVVLHSNGQSTRYDTDPEDKVIALYNNECVGMANIELNEERNTSRVHLTVYGDNSMLHKPVTFLLWQASTGKTLSLTPDKEILFGHGFVYGCMDANPITFTTGGSETQNIKLSAGWSWISSNLKINAPLSAISSQLPWSEGDLFKNPTDRRFCVYSEERNAFVGPLDHWDYRQIYMAQMVKDNTLRLSGEKLTDEDRHITLRGDGQWNVLPCLFDQSTALTDALADYYDHASPGDIIKSRGHFAYFSSDKRWEGDLTALKPGEGYLFQRLGAGTVDVHFYDPQTSAMSKPARVETTKYGNEEITKYENPNAATNMTMIATIVNEEAPMTNDQLPIIKVYVGDELAAVAEPLSPSGELAGSSSLYFLTILSDAAGQPLRFETEDGVVLSTLSESGLSTLSYEPDAHFGSLKAPVKLTPAGLKTYKVIENNHIIIIRNNEKYDVTGKKTR